ncbi:general secretion pathway protein GspB [Cellvibrio sp. QJXJ]|uniref:general secretion pathway protein GspB n=1 Tax=Cellvibrio sp. QJXJ TaxID=2964606 RepID=UPI0021C335D2|nr:general secretion pathway protein GspB [Cellvibrio sp. QJXJ]UUA74117.1 general secretion pathway protein GspB [Cellvibrio sp. QJXJ]
MYKSFLLLLSIFNAVFFLEPASFAQTPVVDAANASDMVRDPTTPLGYAVAPGIAATTNYTLSSVLISAQRKHAVINGATLREGQVVPGSDGVIVKRISPQTVVLQQHTKTWALRLSPSVVIRH